MTRARPNPRPISHQERELRARLLAWYRANRRDLPWRRTRDPYAIWLSEAMLQQTRVETVLAYYARFLERFPTLGELARASEDEVLALWSGLGYYRRARALHAAARRVVERHAGRFPSARAEALALPGVGRYTAGAVLSIAFDAPEPLVDGNVERVFSRLFGLDAPAGSPALVRACWELAARLVPARGAGEWNQALMELGATVCTARAPRCAACPLEDACRAALEGRATELPRKKAGRAALPVELEILVVERGGDRLLELGRGRRMQGLWRFPTRELARADEPPRLFPASWGAALAALDELGALRHTITHHRIRARIRRGSASGDPPDPPFRWFPPARIPGLPLSGMTRKALARLDRSSPAAPRAE